MAWNAPPHPGAVRQVPATANNSSGFSNTSFNGSIDRVGLWNRALSTAEILALFSGTDPLTGGGTGGGGGVTPVPRPAGLALLLASCGLLVAVSRRQNA